MDSATIKVRDLSHYAESWLGQEPASCLIIPQIPMYTTSLQPSTMAETGKDNLKISDGFQHKTVITGNAEFIKLIEDGNLVGLQAYIKNSL